MQRSDGIHHGEGLRSCMIAGFLSGQDNDICASPGFLLPELSRPDFSLEGSLFGNSFLLFDCFLYFRTRIAPVDKAGDRNSFERKSGSAGFIQIGHILGSCVRLIQPAQSPSPDHDRRTMVNYAQLPNWRMW